MERPPICVLLLPRALERFILRDQAEDLLRAAVSIAVDPPRMPYGAFARVPLAVGDALAARQARRLVRTLRRGVGEPRVVVIFHPLQYPLARAIMAVCPGCELWYWRWDRYEQAYDASPKQRERLENLHEQAAERSSTIIVASDELARLEGDAGRRAIPCRSPPTPSRRPRPAARSSPSRSATSAGAPTGRCCARSASVSATELVLLLVGEWHEDECSGRPGLRRLPCGGRTSSGSGRMDDEAAARLIPCADVGIVPFKVEPFNDAALPYRILKYARLGRRTVAPDLAGVRTWARAVTMAADGRGVGRGAAATAPAPGRGPTSRCASGRWRRPRGPRTSRCGSA